jgi:two-component system OmpR family response regulator
MVTAFGSRVCGRRRDRRREGHSSANPAHDAVSSTSACPRWTAFRCWKWRRAGRDARADATARDRWSDKVQGIDAGADDYVAKPFHIEEVLARVRALVRRAAGHASNEIEIGPVRLDSRAGRVTVDGNPVKLTSHEYKVLEYLMHHRERVVSRTELIEHLYDQDFDRDSNTIEVFVGRLRKKVSPDLIETVRGLGYRIVAPQ